jgi:3-oxoacyl-[acyl-carrier-protein] synthase-3
MVQKTKIAGIGTYLPKNIITNKDLSKILDTSDAWIQSRSGIQQRHQADECETTSDLAVSAAKAALAHAKLTPDDIDLIVVATTTPDLTFPATAALVQKKLGMRHGAAFDVQAVCSGFVYGLSVTSAMLETGQAKRALLIGAETMTRLLDMQDRATAVLFGDGAGAIVLEACEVAPEDLDTASHVMGSYLRSDGELSDILYVDGGPSTTGTTGHLRMQGREVYRHAVGNISDAINTLLQRTGMSIADVDWFVPHQANKRIIDGVAKKIGLPLEKTVVTIHQHANTSAASIPLALCQIVQEGKVRRGDIIMLEAMGGGLTWGANLIRW